ncbi:protein of unknown function [Shewanella benthica]|uniref:Uncharacterized protein n=1 Tax=Shewanella benthica TaxID=43661 RepID=A0A330LWG3_9GAMM|nr:protein of unknown function [Shewanella benthica]
MYNFIAGFHCRPNGILLNNLVDKHTSTDGIHQAKLICQLL